MCLRRRCIPSADAGGVLVSVESQSQPSADAERTVSVGRSRVIGQRVCPVMGIPEATSSARMSPAHYVCGDMRDWPNLAGKLWCTAGYGGLRMPAHALPGITALMRGETLSIRCATYVVTCVAWRSMARKPEGMIRLLPDARFHEILRCCTAKTAEGTHLKIPEYQRFFVDDNLVCRVRNLNTSKFAWLMGDLRLSQYCNMLLAQADSWRCGDFACPGRQ